MSGGRIHRGVYVECDGAHCHEFIEGYSSFQDLWNSDEAAGWTSKQVSGEWFNYCPEHSIQGKPDFKKLLGDPI